MEGQKSLGCGFRRWTKVLRLWNDMRLSNKKKKIIVGWTNLLRQDLLFFSKCIQMKLYIQPSQLKRNCEQCFNNWYLCHFLRVITSAPQTTSLSVSGSVWAVSRFPWCTPPSCWIWDVVPHSTWLSIHLTPTTAGRLTTSWFFHSPRGKLVRDLHWIALTMVH